MAWLQPLIRIQYQKDEEIVKKDDLVTLTNEDMGVDGEGIGHVDGCTLFVKDALIGDVINAKVMKMRKITVMPA